MIWEKQIKRETGLGLALPCTRAVFIVFILLLVYYLFMHLSIYFFIRLLAGLPRARSARGTEPHTHRI